MSKIQNHEIRLASRPSGMPTRDNFTLAQTELGSPEDNQVLVRNLFLSVDPYMRGRMNEGKSYVPPFEIGKPMQGGAVGEVIESRAKEFKAGDVVTSNLGWREYFVSSPNALHKVSGELHPRSIYLGALGMTGMTAPAPLRLITADVFPWPFPLLEFLTGVRKKSGSTRCGPSIARTRVSSVVHSRVRCATV